MKDEKNKKQLYTENGEPFIVYYKEKKYDISNFINKHPGGSKVLLEYQNKDITAAFDHVGHSPDAMFLLTKRLVKSDEEIAIEKEKSLKKSIEEKENDLIEENKEKSEELEILKRGKFIVRKLFTEEDKYFIHKVLGLIALISFIYRYFIILPSTGTLGFSNDYFSYITISLHMLLSMSSLIFHVLSSRIAENPLIIYEEYRIHAILFTLRSFFVTIIGMNQDYLGKTTSSTLLVVSILIIHLLVDYVTYLHGTPGITAVRHLDKDEGINKLGKRFYSYYQFLALASHLILNNYSHDLGFNTIIAIQSSAFLMTLKRKNISGWRTHAFFYLLCLFLSTYYIFLVKGYMFMVYVAFLFAFRVFFDINKYLIWFGYTIVSYNLFDFSIINESFI